VLIAFTSTLLLLLLLCNMVVFDAAAHQGDFRAMAIPSSGDNHRPI